MKTYMANAAAVERKWYVIDAQDKVLGRMCTEIADILRGKKKPPFTPYVDCGDNVIVINAAKVRVTGKKLSQKKYYHHSEYVGGMKEMTLQQMLERKPEEVIRHAVKGMLPKGALGHQMLGKLHIYAGAEHKHEAQKPEAYEI